MDDRDHFGPANMLGRLPPRPQVPRFGENEAFDEACLKAMGDDFDGDAEDREELRRAIWMTWRTGAPTGGNMPRATRQEEEDEQLARVLAESARAHTAQTSMRGSRPDSPIVIGDDDDEDFKLALAMSKDDTRPSKKSRREETPEEERKMLAEALAASMASANGAEVVEDGSSDDDLDEANAAFQASRQAFREEEEKRRRYEATKSADTVKAEKSTLSSNSETKPMPVASSSRSAAPLSPAPRLSAGGPLGDRAQMERERLARQAAKDGQTSTSAAASASGSSTATTSQPPRTKSTVTPIGGPRGNIRSFSDLQAETTAGSSSSSRSAGSSNERSTGPSNPHHPLQAHGPLPSDAAGEYYLDGELRHAALTVVGASSERTFSAEQVIGTKDQIALIIMSSFVTDDEWLDTILPDATSVPRAYVRPHPKEFHPAWNGKVQAQADGEVRCYPEMVGAWGSAHMKFAWIFYKTGRLRVAIMTCNMVPYDWDWIENTIFVQDFLPIRQTLSSSSSTATDLPDFPSRFRHLFVHLKVHKALRFLIDQHPAGTQIPFTPKDAFEDMAKYDWSRVRVKLVMSIPGTYSGADKMDDFGICRIGKVLSEENWRPQSDEVVKAEYQGSSLGSYTIDWFDTFYQYCTGKTTRSLLGRPKPIAWPPLKVIYPSEDTVAKSALGKDGGGTMFCGKAYNVVTKHLFHDSNSKRGGVLMHAKVLIAMFEPKEDRLGLQSSSASQAKANGKRKASEFEDHSMDFGGWCYVGSHNFSSAAWGTVNLKKSPPTLNIRNYELGILFPIPRADASKAADAIAPHIRPPRPYSSEDRPWDQFTHQFGSSSH